MTQLAADTAQPDEAPTCAHCGLPVPPAFVEPDGAPSFCCHGCRCVYETIHACGLDRFYELAEASGTPAPTTPGQYETFDDPAFQSSCVQELPDGRRAVELYLDGVHCSACVWLVERLPRVLDGVIESRLDFRRQIARITWMPDRVALSRIARLLGSLGYPPLPARDSAVREAQRRAHRRHLVRIGVAGACAGNVMLIAFALYGGMLQGMAPEYRLLFRWASFVITVTALAWPGRTFFTGAISSLRTGVLHMDVPVAIALAAGAAWGLVNTIRDTGEVYFESLTIVVFLLLVGRWLQDVHRRHALDAVDLLYRLTPQSARRVSEDDAVTVVAVESLEPGDVIEVRPGDAVPADGTITSGRSMFDRSVLTGESRPVDLGIGDRVHAGVTNETSPVRLEVLATAGDTRVGRLMTLVEQYAQERPPIIRLADRLAHVFVATVLALAVGTAAVWAWLDPSLAVEHAIALLIVTCPCALGLATPLAVVAGIGRAARAGMLIKGGETIERLAEPGLVVLDKTGTITQGRLTLVQWFGDDTIKPLVAAVEREVAHPIAMAFTEAFGDAAGDERPDVHRSSDGVTAKITGRSIAIGSTRFAERHGVHLDAWAHDAVASCLERAHSPVIVAIDGAARAVAGFGDPVHGDAAEAVGALHDLGYDIHVLSGDHPEIVQAMAREVGLDPSACAGGVTPEAKAEFVRRAQQRGERVIMVGDGVNDAAALSAADVGIAVHGGAEAAMASADAFVRRPGLGPIVDLLTGSRRVVGVIQRNLVASLSYNIVTAGLAITGVINPLIAAILMPISSLTVVTLSYRGRTFDAEGTEARRHEGTEGGAR